jgi:outer membrane scaffolding protein for murein synthesis (MipA/OmpV family)
MDIPQIVQAVSSTAAIAISIFAVIRSSKQRQDDDISNMDKRHQDDMTNLKNTLTAHAEEDVRVQVELSADLKNNIKLTERLDSKIDKILEKI